MKVKLKRPWFIEGHRYSRAGEYDIPDRFRKHLPSDAKVLDDAQEKPERASPEQNREPEPVEDGGVKPKGYRLMPKTLSVEGCDPVDAKGALRLAVKAFGKSVAEWNGLDEPERKKRIHKAVQDVSGN